jgi:hypothetical protein
MVMRRTDTLAGISLAPPEVTMANFGQFPQATAPAPDTGPTAGQQIAKLGGQFMDWRKQRQLGSQGNTMAQGAGAAAGRALSGLFGG